MTIKILSVQEVLFLCLLTQSTDFKCTAFMLCMKTCLCAFYLFLLLKHQREVCDRLQRPFEVLKWMLSYKFVFTLNYKSCLLQSEGGTISPCCISFFIDRGGWHIFFKECQIFIHFFNMIACEKGNRADLVYRMLPVFITCGEGIVCCCWFCTSLYFPWNDTIQWTIRVHLAGNFISFNNDQMTFVLEGETSLQLSLKN